MTIKSVILDDESHSIKTLRWKLENYCPEVEVVATFDDPLAALDYLRVTPPNLLFLDIEMPMMSGFDVLEEIGRPFPFSVIFTTAYDQFGIQAVKVSALDYLLKPVQNKELQQAVQRYHQFISGTGDQNEQLGMLLDNVQAERQGRAPKVALATKESIEFVDASDIVLCTSDSNYTMVYLADGRKKLISRTLKDFEQILTPMHFFRPHNSHLINLDMVRELIRGDGGYLIMKNKMKVPIAKSRREELLQRLG